MIFILPLISNSPIFFPGFWEKNYNWYYIHLYFSQYFHLFSKILIFVYLFIFTLWSTESFYILILGFVFLLVVRQSICIPKFRWHIKNIAYEITWTWLCRKNLKRETESLLTTTEYNTIWTNCIKATMNKTQVNTLYGKRERWNKKHISECNKIDQKEYKSRYDWDLCKQLNFDHTDKWYRLETALKNKTHQILWDFETKMDH